MVLTAKSWQRRWLIVAAVLAITAVYYGLGKFGLSLASLNASASAVWPPTGFSLAVLLIGGYRLWPAIFLGAFLVNVTTQGPVPVNLAIASGNTLEALAGAWLVHRYAKGVHAFDRPATILQFVLLAAVLTTSISATVGVTSLCLGGLETWDRFGAVWLTWYLGDAVSDLIVAPFLLIWLTKPLPPFKPARALELAVLVLIVFVVCQMAFWERPPFRARDFSLAYFAILPLLWAAFRFDQRGAITCALIVSGFALWATLHSLGPFARGDQNQSLLLVQTFMGTVTLTGLVLAAVIFQRTQDQQALAKWEFIFNHAGWAVAAADPQTNRLDMVNPAFAQMHGYTVDEMIGLPLMDTFAPESRQEFLSHAELTHQRGHYVYESFHQRKDGSKFPVLTQVTALKDAKGRLLLRAATFQDITEQKKAEEALRDAHVLLADKAKHLESLVEKRTAELRELVEELEAFSYSMAHDMRAPLRGMQGFAQILATEYAPQLGSGGKQYLSRIVSAAERLDSLIKDVLQYTKVVRGELKLEPVNLNVLVRDIIDTYPNLSAPNVTITIDGVLPTVIGNTAALTQVISNLLGNAVKFVAPGVDPKIRVRAEQISATVVRLWIEDNGIGIEKAAQTRIFQMFQQLNRSGLYEGTGIGLAIVRKAVERMGGRVGVESEFGKGSAFWIELKRA